MGLKDILFGKSSAKEIKKLDPLVKKITDLKPQVEKMSQADMARRTAELKEMASGGADLDDLLPEAFAMVREATKKTLGTEHYVCQILGGIILHQGRVAEMKTGEGKTQTCLMPAYLNALTGKGVHIVTVNDYLAKRDAEWMGKVYSYLGMSVGVVLNGMNTEERQNAYNCDVTYITNNELGFDYLRDNMAVYKNKQVQRGLNYAIVDEVDSILIDEARTPLIISGQSAKSTDLYNRCDDLARRLVKGEATELTKMDAIMGESIKETGDFVVNEKEKLVTLTAQGITNVERYFNIKTSLADPQYIDIQHNINLALRAHYLMHKDKQYIVSQDKQVLIVDEFTGRIMPGRRYSDGLHQAIEAKEGVEVKRESRTLATITFQNFFNKYAKKAGMTGTAKTEETEFENIYGMDVVEIPTNVPVIRKDLDDAVYKTKREKYNAVVDAVCEAHEKGQPVLVGTITIDTSEMLASMLEKRGLKPNVLNAKFHEQEAEIVAEAGKHGAVTIATNMAGRGTDIKLDDEAKAAGGLKIIGTERHEARRIDNQLRGRSGRQGDPGESKFYLSLEDDIMRLFGSDRMLKVFNALGIEDGTEIHHKMLSDTIERAQKKIETNNFGIRKNLLEYDKVVNDQREVIYAERSRVLNGESMRDSIIEMIDACVKSAVKSCAKSESGHGVDALALNESLRSFMPLKGEDLVSEEEAGLSQEELCERLCATGHRLYEEKEKEFEEFVELPEGADPSKKMDVFRELERIVLLRVVDRHWMNHIDDMDQLKQGIGLAAYGQKDPLVEYRMAGFDMFDDMIAGIQADTAKQMLNLPVKQLIVRNETKREEVAKPVGTNKDEKGVRAPQRRSGNKIYPNDPCPCGSGKKYKKCCGRKA